MKEQASSNAAAKAFGQGGCTHKSNSCTEAKKITDRMEF